MRIASYNVENMFRRPVALNQATWLRWAAFEAAESACKPSSPDHTHYLQLKERVGQNRAVLSIARKLLRRAHHTLRELGDDALAPAA